MRPALAQDDAADGRPAGDAWLAVTMIHAMEGRKVARFSARVAEVRDGAAAMPDAGTQDGPNRSPQGLDLDPAQGRRPSRGPDARAEKGFVRVDVPDAGDLSLI